MVSANPARRSRPSDGPAEPPAKRLKQSRPKATTLASIVLGDKRKPLKAVTSNGIDMSKSHIVNAGGAVLGTADEGADVDMTDVIGAKRSLTAGKTARPEQIGDDEESDEDDELSSEEDAPRPTLPINGVSKATARAMTNGHASESESSSQRAAQRSDAQQADEETSGPSLGELALANRGNSPIDVEAPFANPSALTTTTDTSRYPTSMRNLTAPTATSLSTVLTQALKTNDKQLLESCLEINDLDSIRTTIERLPSHLVAALLTSIAERMHRFPGRANSLMIWVQWSLVAHGGYLASQPQVVQKLKGLQRVIRMRAESLQRLLPLKGRLDMISAQMELRASMMAQSSEGRRLGREEEEDEAIIYIEGQEDIDGRDEMDDEQLSADEDEMDTTGLSTRQRQIASGIRPTSKTTSEVGDEDEDSEDDGFMALLPNGHHESDEEESADDLDKLNLVDDEAESTENEASDEGDFLDDNDEADKDVEEDDEDDLEDDEDDDDSGSEEEAAPRLRRSNAARTGGFAV